MNKCKRCGVRVLDDTLICPLCHTVLTEEKEDEQEYAGDYPNVKQKTRKFHRAGRILLFLSLVLEAALILVNYLTFSSFPKCWSAITGGIIAYLILTLWDLLSRRQGHIQKIYMHIFVVMGLLLLIDVSLGWKGWSLEFGLPCMIYGLVAAIVICMAINSSSWQNYVLMQLAAVCLSMIDVVLHFTGFFHHIVLVWTALGLSVLLWSGTMIIGYRKAKNELKRKFHI